MIGLAILEVFDIVMAAMKVAKTIREEAPEIYDAIQGDQPINWSAALLPEIHDEPDDVTLMSTNEALVMMARTIYGEARNEGWPGLIAVGHVIRNRAEKGGWWGNDIISVCRKPKQFSCWNTNDPNLPRLLGAKPDGDAAFRQCLAAAVAVMSGLEPSPVGRSTHYHTTAISPGWAKGKRPKVTIGAHVFYEGIA